MAGHEFERAEGVDLILAVARADDRTRALDAARARERRYPFEACFVLAQQDELAAAGPPITKTAGSRAEKLRVL